MPESLGVRLRQRREQQGIDLIAIAAQTKIKMSLLEGLERDDLSHWPSGIFRRAYVRTYAQVIGLDPDVIVREFLELYPEPAEVVTTEAIASALDGGRTPPTRLSYLVGSAIGSLAKLRRSAFAESSTEHHHAEPEHLEPARGARAEAAHVHVGPSAPVPPQTALVDDEAESVPLPEAVPWDVALPGASEHVQGVNSLPAESSVSDDLDRLLMQPARNPDLSAVAELCTDFARVVSTSDLPPLLERTARILDAAGVIVWIQDSFAEGLRPVLAHGYSKRVVAQLPLVSPHEDNATAAAFRSERTCAVAAGEHTNAALAVPLLTPEGCAGVLAIEFNRGQSGGSIQACARIVGALLAQLLGAAMPSGVELTPSNDRRAVHA